MRDVSPSEEEVFNAARKIGDADARRAYVDNACGGDEALLARVRALVTAHEASGAFMRSPVGHIGLTPQQQAALSPLPPGSTVGPYTLVQLIGEGGFGWVYRAEQRHPVRRTVALKILRPGVESPQVLSRFDHERQALALMDHPNIAKVLDAGTTESGRPYFVMELVEGTPITRYCDERRLTPRQRLELFVQVCHAVQHAHQKAIIHRDLKPSNVLVALYDGRPVPKVIDFGVAKASGGPLSEHTAFTGFGQMVGTLEYMSPEQAELNQLDVDTRSDIYSLGVLLYELLTGMTPIDGKRLKEAALLEALRLIREEEPQKPSTKLSGSRELPSIAASRGVEPKKFSRLVKGELDWIVMKCLEKDRTRRYETANGLALDVLRHLNDEPVAARPQGGAYRLRKFVRRHRVGVSAGGAVLLALLLGVTGTTMGMIRAIHARTAEGLQRTEADGARANVEGVNRFLIEMLEAADPHRSKGEQVLVRDVLDRAATKLDAGSLRSQPRTEAAVRHTLGSTYGSLRLNAAAEAQFQAALDLRRRLHPGPHPDLADSAFRLAGVLHVIGRQREAEALCREALDMQRRLVGDRHPAAAKTMSLLANIYAHSQRPTEAEQLFRETIALEREVAPDAVDLSLNNLGYLFMSQGKPDDAEAVLREALEVQRRVAGAEDPSTLTNLGLLRKGRGDLPGAEAFFRRALERQVASIGDQSPDAAFSMSHLANVLSERGDHAAAETWCRRALEIRRKTLGEENTEVAKNLNNLALILAEKRDLAAAEPVFREALALRRKLLGEENRDVALTLNGLARVLMDKGDVEAAEPMLRQALAMLVRLLDENDQNLASSRSNLARLRRDKGDLAEAAGLYEKALEGYRNSLGERHDYTINALYNLADVYEKQGRLAAAEPMYEQAVDCYRKHIRADHPDAQRPFRTLVALRIKQGRLDDAEALLRQELDRRVTTLGERQKATADLFSMLAFFLRDNRRDPAAAVEPFRKALAIYTAVGGEQATGTAATLSNLAATLGQVNQAGEAKDLYRRALAIPVGAWPTPAYRTRTAYQFAKLLTEQREYDQAGPLWVEVGNWLKVPENRRLEPKAAEIAAEIEQFYAAWGKPAEADQWKRELSMGNDGEKGAK